MYVWGYRVSGKGLVLRFEEFSFQGFGAYQFGFSTQVREAYGWFRV